MITAKDIEQMTNTQLIDFFKSSTLETRVRIANEFYTQEDEIKRMNADSNLKEEAERNGYAVKEFKDADINYIKRLVFVVAIPAYIDMGKFQGTFTDVFNEYAKCSRKTCPNPATYYLYKTAGVGKGSWKTTVKRKQYCKSCLEKKKV